MYLKAILLCKYCMLTQNMGWIYTSQHFQISWYLIIRTMYKKYKFPDHTLHPVLNKNNNILA